MSERQKQNPSKGQHVCRMSLLHVDALLLQAKHAVSFLSDKTTIVLCARLTRKVR